MDVDAERLFQSLKRKLNAFHYCEPLCNFISTNSLALESAPLTNRLLTELLKVNDGFQKQKETVKRLEKSVKDETEAVTQ
jgi:hypothetical protein